MGSVIGKGVQKESAILSSGALERNVLIDFYLPPEGSDAQDVSLLLINDGQDLEKLGLVSMLDELYQEKTMRPLLCAGIHAGPERKLEYGTALRPDFKGRGNKAALYTEFITNELIPSVQQQFGHFGLGIKSFAGFSLGGLSAFDITWNHPRIFTRAGIFSASLWWRSLDKDDPDYQDAMHRIIHNQVRNGGFDPSLKFFFECGTLDETADRNGNGIIDSIDDTKDLITELVSKGYDPLRDIHYLELEGGRHDVATWADAMPAFLKWLNSHSGLTP